MVQRDDGGVATENLQPAMTEEELNEKSQQWRKRGIGYFFPIIPEEMSRFFCMLAIFSACAFSYNLLRIYKDKILHTDLEPSAQNWLKIFTFLASLAFVTVIQKLLVNRTIAQVFDICCLTFIALLVGVGFLVKYRHYIQPRSLWAQELFLAGTAQIRGLEVLYILVLIINNWALSFFYVVCEVMGSIMLSFLCLTYFNSFLTGSQNKRFIRFLYIGSNLATVIAALGYNSWNKGYRNMAYEEREKYNLYFPLLISFIFCLMFVAKKVLDRINRRPLVALSKAPKKKTTKRALSISDSVYLAFASRLLLSICSAALFCNVSQMLVTSMAANAQKAAATYLEEDAAQFSTGFKSKDLLMTAVSSIIIMIIPFPLIFDYFGIATPSLVPIIAVAIGTTATCALAMINYPMLGDENMKILRFLEGMEPRPRAEVWVNLWVGVALKATKYGFFDTDKESISMKINPEDRPLYKGIADGVIGKLGKCLASIYGIVGNAMAGNNDSRSYALPTGILQFGMLFCWWIANRYLRRKYAEVQNTDAYLSPDYFEGAKVE